MPDIRATLPTLERIEQSLQKAVDELTPLSHILSIVDDDSEDLMVASLRSLKDAIPLVVWVKGEIESLPVPRLALDPVAAAFAPADRHELIPSQKTLTRSGDGFIDLMIDSAPTIDRVAVRRAMLEPLTAVSVLDGKGFLAGRYSETAPDNFEKCAVAKPDGESPMVSYRSGDGAVIAASRIRTAAMIWRDDSNAPMDLIPANAGVTLKEEHGPWCVVHMLLENTTRVVAVLPPCVLQQKLMVTPAWPIQALTLVASGIYDDSRISVTMIRKEIPGIPKGSTPNRLGGKLDQIINDRKQQRADAHQQIIDAMDALRPKTDNQRGIWVPTDVGTAAKGSKYGGAMVLPDHDPQFQVDLQKRIRELAEERADVRWAKPAKPDPEPQLTLLQTGPAPESMAEKTARKRADTAAQQRADEERLAKVVFSYWQDVMGKQRSLFDVRRKTRIVTRLRENSGDVGELLYAIDGAEKDDWLMGRDPQSNGKKYNDIDTIFRDRAQVEKLAETMRGYQRDEEHPVVLAMGAQP